MPEGVGRIGTMPNSTFPPAAATEPSKTNGNRPEFHSIVNVLRDSSNAQRSGVIAKQLLPAIAAVLGETVPDRDSNVKASLDGGARTLHALAQEIHRPHEGDLGGAAMHLHCLLQLAGLAEKLTEVPADQSIPAELMKSLDRYANVADHIRGLNRSRA